MLNRLIVMSFICWISTFFVKGVTLYTILLIIPTLMFSARKINYIVRTGNIFVVEILLLFFSLMWQLIFNKFNIIKLLIIIGIRLVFLGIALYDDKCFVYISEERKRKQ